MSRPSESDLNDVPWHELAIAAIPVAVVTYALPSILALFNDGTVGLPVAPAILGTVRIAAWNRWASPASAYTHDIARHMPGATWWWIGAALIGLCALVLTLAVWRRLEPAAAAPASAGAPTTRADRARARGHARATCGELTSRRTTRADASASAQLDGRTLYAPTPKRTSR